MGCCCPCGILLKPSIPWLFKNSTHQELKKLRLAINLIPRSVIHIEKGISINVNLHKDRSIVSKNETEFEKHRSTENCEDQKAQALNIALNRQPPSAKHQRRRYRKQYPGELQGITEEMRFVTMKLRNGIKRKSKNRSGGGSGDNDVEELKANGKEEELGNSESWQPSMQGFLKYLVDSKLVFDTVECIVNESSDVSYVYFRKTGLERSGCLSKDLEWLRELGHVIPQPSNPGVTYAHYLKDLADKSNPLFLSHFYNIYFSHIAGGQVIAKMVSEKLLEGRALEFYRWEGDPEELLRGVREKLNALGEHWSREEKNRCLREATKTFRFLGQIVRLIIL